MNYKQHIVKSSVHMSIEDQSKGFLYEFLFSFSDSKISLKVRTVRELELMMFFLEYGPH